MSASPRRRFAVDLLLFVAVHFAVWSLRATVLFSLDEGIASPVWRAAYSDLLKLALWVLPAAIFVSRVRKASPARYLGLSVAPSVRTWSLCLAVTTTFLVLVGVTETLAGGKVLSPGRLLPLSTTILPLQFVLSTLFEEILFRGLVLKELLVLLPATLASTVDSLLFVAIHLPYWLFHGGANQPMPANYAGIFLFSLVASWLYARSSSIWPPVVAHIANNLLTASLLLTHA
jgi:uncharacterized protein